jgi:hypothetical protein
VRVTVKESGDDVEKELTTAAERAADVHAISDVVYQALIGQNSVINFDPNHKDSRFEEKRNGWRFGSEHPHYFKLMDVDDDALADIIVTWIVDGKKP